MLGKKQNKHIDPLNGRKGSHSPMNRDAAPAVAGAMVGGAKRGGIEKTGSGCNCGGRKK